MAMSDDELIENSEDDFIDFYYESNRLSDQEYAEGGKFILFFPLQIASEKWDEAKEFYRRNELPGILMIRYKYSFQLDKPGAPQIFDTYLLNNLFVTSKSEFSNSRI